MDMPLDTDLRVRARLAVFQTTGIGKQLRPFARSISPSPSTRGRWYSSEYRLEDQSGDRVTHHQGKRRTRPAQPSSIESCSYAPSAGA